MDHFTHTPILSSPGQAEQIDNALPLPLKALTPLENTSGQRVRTIINGSAECSCSLPPHTGLNKAEQINHLRYLWHPETQMKLQFSDAKQQENVILLKGQNNSYYLQFIAKTLQS